MGFLTGFMILIAFSCLTSAPVGSTFRTATCDPMTNVVYTNFTSGFIVSHGYELGKRYPPLMTCSVTLTAPLKEQRIRLDFEDMDLETSSYCARDRLWIDEILEGTEIRMGTYCSTRLPRPLLSAHSNTVRIKFASDRLRAGRGFKIRFAATNDYTLCPGGYQCWDRSCIPASQVCDGHFDCPDGTDEECGPAVPELAQPAKCGVPPIEPFAGEDRIVGGEEARPGSWPWQVSIQTVREEPMGHECGGSLIDNEWVITAQHCVERVKVHDIIVKAGSHDHTMREDTEQIRRVSHVFPYPSLTANNRDFDIGLIKLRTPVNFTDHVQPACLPKNSFSVPAIGSKCYTTGWGDTRGTGHWNRLKQTPVLIEPFDMCMQGTATLFGKTQRRNICGIAPNGLAGACSGDSGGPLVCQNTKGAWILQGVSSLTSRSTVTSPWCGMGDHTVWVKVSSFLNWIRDVQRTT